MAKDLSKVEIAKNASQEERNQFLDGNVPQASQDITLARGGAEYTWDADNDAAWTFAKSYGKDGNVKGRFLVLLIKDTITGEMVTWYPTSVRKTIPSLVGMVCRGDFSAKLRTYLASDEAVSGKDVQKEFKKGEILPNGAIRTNGTVVADEHTAVTDNKETVTIHLSGNRCLLEWLRNELRGKKMRCLLITHRYAMINARGNKVLSERPQMMIGFSLEGDADFNDEGTIAYDDAI